MKIIAFIIDYAAVDRIIDHLKLRFIAEKPPPSRVFTEVGLMGEEKATDYFLAGDFADAGGIASSGLLKDRYFLFP